MHFRGAGSTGIQSAYGPVGNPWNPEHVGGGSSGGSASAVGARMVAGSVGADGGGSIRLPAAYCGVVGIKPTYNAVPVDGNIHGYLDLDALGPFARDADDTRLMLEALAARKLPPGDATGPAGGHPPLLLGRPGPRGRARTAGTCSTRPAGRPRTSTSRCRSTRASRPR